MFLDNIQSQSNSQNTNLSNYITLGSSGTEYGSFSPINETKPEFKSSNDLGLSAALGAGSTSGSVGMSRQEDNQKSGSAYDGYNPQPQKESMSTNTMLFIGGILVFLVSAFGFFKKKKYI